MLLAVLWLLEMAKFDNQSVVCVSVIQTSRYHMHTMCMHTWCWWQCLLWKGCSDRSLKQITHVFIVLITIIFYYKGEKKYFSFSVSFKNIIMHQTALYRMLQGERKLDDLYFVKSAVEEVVCFCFTQGSADRLQHVMNITAPPHMEEKSLITTTQN